MSAATVPLGELMPVKRRSVDPRKHPNEEFELFSIPAFDAGAPETVRGSDVGSSKQVLERHDVLLSKIVPHIRRSWVVEPNSERRSIGSSEWIVFRSDRFEPRYLRHVLMSDRFHQAFLQTVAGVGGSLLRARPSYVAEIEIPLPAVKEQQRIAVVLDAAESLRAKRREALIKLDDLTQSAFIDMFGDPVQNEYCWPNACLGEVAQFVRGITFKPVDVVEAGETGSIVCLRTKNVQAEVDLDDLIAVAPKFVKRQDQYLQAGDVLISSANSWNLVGKCCWIPELPWPASFGGFVTVLRPATESVERRYLFEWFRHQRIQQLLRSFGRKTTNISNLNLDRCRSMVFPLPPVDLQRQFVDAVARIRHHRSTLEASAATLDTLFASLQQRAFRGEL